MQRLSISQRISGGFLIVVLSMVGLATFAVWNTVRMQSAFEENGILAHEIVVLNEYLDEVLTALSAANEFRVTHGTDAVQQVTSHIDMVTQSEESETVFAADPEALEDMRYVKDELVHYREAFLRAVDLQLEQDVLVSDMRELGYSTREALSEIFLGIRAQNSAAGTTAAAQAQEAFILARLYTERFLLTGAQEDIATAQTHLDDAARQARILSNVIGDIPTWNERAEQIPAAVEAFGVLMQRGSETVLEINRINREELDVIGFEVEHRIASVIARVSTNQEHSAAEGQQVVETATFLIIIVGAAAAITAGLLAIFVGRSITGAVRSLADTTDELAQGNLSAEIHGAEFNHELGRMAKALEVFKSAQEERVASQEQRETAQREQEAVVVAVSEQLNQLSDGYLSAEIIEEFPPQFEGLRTNFNTATERLRSAFRQVVDTAGEIGGNAKMVGEATVQLSGRTETQAATLAETAATMNAMNESVSQTANGTKEANSYVVQTRERADASTAVVSEAVTAMDNIQDSSEQISKIIGLIEDIAFQTNLLALNAGVEAARAGEAGQGFAVVASEVRALAKRSSEAASEIKGLITSATENVETGVRLVGETGSSLKEIAEMVDHIAKLVSEISDASGEQANGLSEVNVAVGELESVTQQNAAMVEETAGSAQQLSDDAERLLQMTAQFNLDEADRVMNEEMRMAG